MCPGVQTFLQMVHRDLSVKAPFLAQIEFHGEAKKVPYGHKISWVKISLFSHWGHNS